MSDRVKTLMSVSGGITLGTPEQHAVEFRGCWYTARLLRIAPKQLEKERYYKTGRGRDHLDRLDL
jgi:hypothetical protein